MNLKLSLEPDVTLPIFTNESLHYENNKKDNIYIKIGNPPLERLWGWAIPSYITTKSHCVPCNM